MQIKRRIFEYGILSMGLSCVMIFLILSIEIFEFILELVLAFDLRETIIFLQTMLQSGNYSQILLIFVWGFFFVGLTLVTLSLIAKIFSNIFLRSNLLSELPEVLKKDPERLGIVIPTYNEAETLGDIIRDCKNYSKNIVVIDDGSTDNTSDLLTQFPEIHVLRNEINQGLGAAMKKGLEYAAKLDIDAIVTFDADGQYRTEEIPKISHFILTREADLVLGSRFAGQIERMSFSKRLGNKMMSFALSLMLGIRITDGQTGFRGISTHLVRSYKLRGEYTYTQETIIQARFMNSRILEIPIFFDKRKIGESRLIRTPVDYAWRSWLTIIRTLRDFQPIWFFGGFGILAFLLGLFFFSITSVSSVVFPVPFDLTIFSTILLLVGIQFMYFGLLADTNRPNI